MTRLYLDISSTCTGYVVAEEEKLLEYGVIWFPKEAKTPDKCHFIYEFVYDKFTEHLFTGVVYESYSFNTKNPNGALVCPQLQGAVMAITKKLGLEIDEITPQTWRKNCGIKPVKTEKKKRDYKIPTEAYFRAKYEVPEKIESNITGKLRTTPSDLFDAMGVHEGWIKNEAISGR